MVRIAIDYEDEDWMPRALRVLKAGGALISVPGDRVERLAEAARESGIEFELREPGETDTGWSLDPGELPE